MDRTVIVVIIPRSLTLSVVNPGGTSAAALSLRAIVPIPSLTSSDTAPKLHRN
jgi:hypothetical protein